MKIGRPTPTTRTLGLDQRYKPLPVRDVIMTDPNTGESWGQATETVWFPSPEQIGAIVLGHPVKVRLLVGPDVPHPPMLVLVGDVETIG